MLSERRSAQLGLVSACTLLMATLTILYRGSRQSEPPTANQTTASAPPAAAAAAAHHDTETARLAAAVMGK